MDTEALRSLVACYRDPAERQRRCENKAQLHADLDTIERAADTIDRLQSDAALESEG